MTKTEFIMAYNIGHRDGKAGDYCPNEYDDMQMIDVEPCSDAISRAEAQTEIMMFAGNCKSDEEDIYIKVSDAVQLLRDLPSVNAEPRTGQSKSIPSGLKLKIEHEADYQNERVNADIARGMYLALEIIDKWEANNA